MRWHVQHRGAIDPGVLVDLSLPEPYLTPTIS